jgi:hypothetical protein
MRSLCHHALALAKRGLHVFPLRPRSKKPLKGSNGHLDASTDEDTIRHWWREHPAYNIGIACGPSGLLVVDNDGPEGKAEWAELEASNGGPVPTVSVITGGGGQHVYFKQWPENLIRNSVRKLTSHVDTRGLGGYVLAPPSIHDETGEPYAWVSDSKTIAAAPAWLLAKLQGTPRAGNDVPGNIPASKALELAQLFVEGVVEGKRNDSVARLSGYLLRRYVHPRIVLHTMQIWNRHCCHPPLHHDEVRAIVDSICGRELERRGAA